MKVDGNGPAFPALGRDPLAPLDVGVTVRLWIATQFLAGRFANDASDFGDIGGTLGVEESAIALHWADALIRQHNATCEGETEA